MVGGILASVLISKNDAGFTHNGALAGLIAICSGSAVVHPLAAFVIGATGGLIIFALTVGFLAFGFMKLLTGLRLSPHEEFVGSDRSIHNIEAYPEEAL